jgi:hypothetical protein
MDDMTPDERRLRAAFGQLVAPPGARRWESAPQALPAAWLDRRLRRLERRARGRRLAPIAFAGLIAVTAAGAGLAFGLRGHEPGQNTGVGSSTPTASATVPPEPTASATPPVTPSPTSVAARPAAGFTCVPRSGGTSGTPAQLTAVRVAHQAGFDRITFEFSPPQQGTPLGNHVGIPEYQITPQASSVFTRDASGARVTLDGTAGLRVVFRDASGIDLNGTSTYTGSSDLKPALPTVREVAELGDFERVLTWGAGLSSAQCVRVTELAGPLRVVIDVQS